VVIFPHDRAGRDKAPVPKSLTIDEQAVGQEFYLFDLPGSQTKATAQHSTEGLSFV